MKKIKLINSTGKVLLDEFNKIKPSAIYNWYISEVEIMGPGTKEQAKEINEMKNAIKANAEGIQRNAEGIQKIIDILSRNGMN